MKKIVFQKSNPSFERSTKYSNFLEFHTAIKFPTITMKLKKHIIAIGQGIIQFKQLIFQTVGEIIAGLPSWLVSSTGANTTSLLSVCYFSGSLHLKDNLFWSELTSVDVKSHTLFLSLTLLR